MFENADQAVIRRNPMVPRIVPRARPASTSRRMTRHQSRTYTSPSAIARMTNVVACEPELPPLEMISGTNSARTTAFSISLSKNPMAVVVSISPRNREPQNPDFLNFAGRLILGNFQYVVQSYDADQTPVESTTGSAFRSSRLNTSIADSWGSAALSATNL